MKEDVKENLIENFDAPYEKEEDENIPHLGEKRKPVITLRRVNQLKKMRNEKREELAQDSVFLSYLYGPPEQPEGGDMMGGLPM